MNAVTSFEQAQKIHYAEVRRRLFGRPERKVVEKVAVPAPDNDPAPVPQFPRLEKKAVMAVHVERREPNLWEQYPPIEFNAHVIAYRRFLLIKEMEPGDNDRAPQIERKLVLDIVREVLKSFPGVTVEDLKGSHRSRYLVKARHMAMYEVYMQRRDLSYPAIGRWFGNRDHTTALHAVKKVAAMKGMII